MAQSNTLNVKLSNLQFSKLKSGIQNAFFLDMIDDSNDEFKFLHKLLLTD